MRPTAPRVTGLGVVDAVAIPTGLAVATFLAATPWLRAFSVPRTAGLLAIASVAAVSISFLVVRWWRQPPAVSYVLSAAGLVILLLAAAGLHPAGVWHGLTTGPNQVLTETLPLRGGRTLLAAPLTLTWLCGATSAELISRASTAPGAKRAGAADSGQAALGLAVPVVCFVVAYAVSASRPGADKIAAPLLLVTLVGVAMLRRVLVVAATPEASVGPAVEEQGRPSIWRPTLAWGAVAVVLALVLAMAVPSVPRLSSRPVSLNRAAPIKANVLNDPLDIMAGLRDDNPRSPARTVLRVRTAEASTGYLATVVLDNYDGGTWSFDTTFEPTGGRVPGPNGTAAAAAGLGSSQVRQQFAIVQPLPVPFLPALDRPVDVTGQQVAVDAATGMLMPERANGDLISYRVASSAPLATLDRVPAADGVGVTSSGDLALPPYSSTAMATALRFLSTITGRRPAPTVGFLQAVVTGLHAEERRLDPGAAPANPPARKATQAARPVPTTAQRKKKTAPARPVPTTHRKKTQPARPVPTTAAAPMRGNRSSGTSLSVVINAVVNQRSATPEQFATLYAMVARYMGVPARVVSGFRMGPGSSTGPVPAGNYTVTNRQAWTWVEIPVAGMGWVVADPTPNAVVGIGSPPPQAVQVTPTIVRPNQANAVPSREIAGGHAVAKPAVIRAPRNHQMPWWVLGLVVLGGAAVAAALLGPGLAGARRVLRRRARRQDEPAQLAVGAWLELLDGLQQAGMATRSADTAEEVASAAGQVFGPDLTGLVQDVGAVAERAVFSVSGPPDHPEAQQAWATQRTVRRTIHRSLDRRQRARALLAVGSAPRRPSAASGFVGTARRRPSTASGLVGAITTERRHR